MFWLGLIIVIVCVLVVFGPFIAASFSTNTSHIEVNLKALLPWVLGLLIGAALMIFG